MTVPIENIFPLEDISENETFSTHYTMTGLNKSIYADVHSLEAKQSNDTLYSDYPYELLLFGASAMALFSITGIAGNLISILALYKCKKIWNSTTAFIVNLCAADMLFCSTAMPQTFIIFLERTWNYGDGLCQMFAFIKYSNSTVSILSVIAITMNRYILILHPRLFPKVYTKKNVAIMIGMMWVSSFSVLLLPLLKVWGALGYDPKVGDCTIKKHNGKSPKAFDYIVTFVVPSLLFLCCYIKIYWYVKKSNKKILKRQESQYSTASENFQHRSDRKAFRLLQLMLVMFICYIVCYFPLTFVKIFHKEKDLPVLNILGYICFFSTDLINPVIYIFMSKEYRNAYKELFFSRSSLRREHSSFKSYIQSKESST